MKLSWLLTLAAPMILAGSVHGAADYFLQIEGIKGESASTAHPDTIEVLSFSWGASNETSNGSGGPSQLRDFTFTTVASKASPLLMLACATGQPITKATLYVRKEDTDTEDYLIIDMSDILVSSVQQEGLGRKELAITQAGATSGDADDRPTEEVAFYYNRAVFSYKGPDGKTTRAELSRTATQ